MHARWLLVALTVTASARAMPPCATDDSTTLGQRSARLELTRAPGDVAMALHAGLLERVQGDASVGVAADAFAQAPALDLKWRVLEASERSGLAVRLGQTSAGRDLLLVAGADLGPLAADVNAGVLGDSGYSSLLLSVPAPGGAFVALELAVEAASDSAGILTGKAAVVKSLNDAAAVSFDLSPQHVVGGETALAATVAVSVGVDFALGPAGSELR